ncbi:MAG: PAS domain-containing sensor histidine kinase [Mariniphaga sp.]|nr:PAS domain-containing sensor histidine kinase [Mariniphaga sp.]
MQRLRAMGISLVSIVILAGLNFTFQWVTGAAHFCIFSHAVLVLAGFFALGCLVNRKINCVLNTTFLLPLLIYFCNGSEFSVQAGISGSVYYSVGWLLAGAFFLFYFSDSKIKIIFYAILSASAISFQLLRLNQPDHLLDGYTPLLAHPLVVFILFIAGGMLLRYKYDKQAEQLQGKLKGTRESVSSLIRDTVIPVAEIKVSRDAYGNETSLIISRVNPAFESVFKIQLHEVRDQEAGYLFGLVLKEPFDLQKFLQSESGKSREFFARKLDLWLKIHVLKSDYSTYYVLLENITKEKSKLTELENSKKRYKVLLEAIPDMFFVIGRDGTYEDFVIKESDLYKIEEANIVGRTLFDVGFPAPMAEKILACIHSCIRYNSLETIEYSLNTPNGTYLYEMRLAKLTSNSVISVARDITRRKNAEFNLEKARKKAEESDRLKSAFLANLSHEIRTPLNIITNFTRILAEGKPSSFDRSELVNAILQNGTQLLNMIDNTIHLSKIETDTVEVNMDFCHINTLIRDIFVKYKSRIDEDQQVSIKMNLDVPHSSFGFVTDRRLLQEVLQILADNAVKYTLKGEIQMGYEMVRNEAVKFSVTDSGIGIPEEEQELIFSRFYRVKNSINEMTSGSGLGLSIAQHYIRMLGGELQLKSLPGKGTAFSFTIPFKSGEGYLKVVS